jgi:asparagine synthase (glutamine-hydrolysing)
MCGICGVVFLDPDRRVDAEVLVAMRDTLAPRGPDEAGLYLDGNVGLASRRLSIIDLAEGHQPMANEDESVWVVFNGEIYNFKEVRQLLQTRGHKFRTNSDTEVILHAYEEEGLDCLGRFNGMFAFALYDKKARHLFLARDRIGVKPLHYLWDSRRFLFASEIKALLRDSSVSRELDPLSLSKYLTYEYVPAPHSMFRVIQKLEPGYLLLLDIGRGTLTKRRYWDIPLFDDNLGYKREDDYQEELLYRLEESVRLRLVSDVPVGIFLSGGIDSSTVAAFANKHHGSPIVAFTIAFDDKSFDESAYATRVGRTLGVDHRMETFNSGKMCEILPRVVDAMDEPLADASILPTYLLSEFAARHVKVVMGGDGGDELFAGYPTFQALKLIRYYDILPHEFRNLILKCAQAMPVSHRNFSLDFKFKQLLRGAGVSREIMFFLWMGSFTEREKRDLLTGEIWDQVKTQNTFEDLFDYIKESNLKNEVERALYLMMKLYLQDDVLVKVDRASMANSLEVRAPFLDYTFVEFAVQLPTLLKLRRLTTKYLLKRAATSLLPRGITHRPKKGFGIPVGKWILSDLRAMFQDYLGEARIRREGVFNPAFVRRLLDDHLARRRDNRKLLWTLLTFQLWRERWLSS